MEKNEIKDLFSSCIQNHSNLVYLTELIAEAKSRYDTTSFPSRKEEHWKNTEIGALFSEKYVLAEKLDLQWIPENLAFPDILDAYKLVFVNGHYAENLSDSLENTGVAIQTGSNIDHQILKELYERENIAYFPLLNDCASDALVHIQIQENKVVEKPILVYNLFQATQATMICPKICYSIGSNSQAKIVLTYDNISKQDGKVFYNSVQKIKVLENAQLEIISLINDLGQNLYFNSFHAEQKKDSTLSCLSFNLSTKFVRNELQIDLLAENCECNLYGLNTPQNEQIIDNYTFIRHQSPYCQSNELYKSIVGEKSNSVFLGRIFVAPHAPKTLAFQQNSNLLLSSNGKVSSKPQLEIFTDDVKCSHGSSTGQIDSNALFYMRSRGIDMQQAKNLLISAFAAEVVSKISLTDLKDYIAELTNKVLN